MDYKEFFREQALNHNTPGVIDSSTFSTIFPVNGCFKYDGKHIVYSIDEQDHIYDVKRYRNPIQAYSDLAGRLGFEFKISDPPKYYLQEISRRKQLTYERVLTAPITFVEKYGMDCKEFFRKQVLQHKDACEHCIIDNSTFSGAYPIDGCFEFNGQYVVYSTDERAQVYNVQRYTNSFEAYSELAKRLGFELKTPEIDPQEDYLTEIFRKKLSEYNEAIISPINCDIDSLCFSEMSPVHGCFNDVNSWYVYSIDEQNNIFNVEKHTTCYDAYSDLAKRIGFEF